MSHQLPPLNSARTDSSLKHTENRVKLSAERVQWMARTSDAYGSYEKTDMESYLTLIRRKVQEKCNTYVELISIIRRLKRSESKVITPPEFRYILIKFGVILAQPLVDRIFGVFDAGHSKTIDIDVFASWAMYSEFKSKVSENFSPYDPESPAQQLRRKFLTSVRENSKAFENLDMQVNFIEFISFINLKNIKLTDKEARTVFQILDRKDGGSISKAALLQWAETGRDDYVEKNDRPSGTQVSLTASLVPL